PFAAAPIGTAAMPHTTTTANAYLANLMIHAPLVCWFSVVFIDLWIRSPSRNRVQETGHPIRARPDSAQSFCSLLHGQRSVDAASTSSTRRIGSAISAHDLGQGGKPKLARDARPRQPTAVLTSSVNRW